MKTPRLLLQVGGALNALFFLFHLWLGWNIHHWKLPPDLRALLEMMNGGGALALLFLAVGALAFPADVLSTRLGRAVLTLGAALYLLRALAETCVTPVFHPLIFGACLIAGLVHLAALLLAPRVTVAPVAA